MIAVGEIVSHTRVEVMFDAKKFIAATVLALAVTANATLSFAQTNEPKIGAARAAAIHECNVKAQVYALYAWGNVQLYVYRACMAGQHQVE